MSLFITLLAECLVGRGSGSFWDSFWTELFITVADIPFDIVGGGMYFIENARASVEKSCCMRTRLQTSEDVYIVNHGTAAQIKQVFATPAITSAPPLPESQMGQSMFDCDSLTQRGFAQLVSVAVGSFT